MADDAVRVSAGNKRVVQVVREGRIKRFDAKRQAVFLEWFAATCNVALSAEKAGVVPQTVFKHRMKDPVFAEGWRQAMAQGYARLEAELVRAASGASPPTPTGEISATEVEAASTAEPIKPELRLAILKEHNAQAERDGRSGRRPGARAVPLTDAELRVALVKRLVVFGIRVRGE